MRHQREMVRGRTGRGYTVLHDGVAMAVDVPFEIAHTFVHEGCELCAADEDHTAPSFDRAANNRIGPKQ